MAPLGNAQPPEVINDVSVRVIMVPDEPFVFEISRPDNTGITGPAIGRMTIYGLPAAYAKAVTRETAHNEITKLSDEVGPNSLFSGAMVQETDTLMSIVFWAEPHLDASGL